MVPKSSGASDLRARRAGWLLAASLALHTLVFSALPPTPERRPSVAAGAIELEVIAAREAAVASAETPSERAHAPDALPPRELRSMPAPRIPEIAREPAPEVALAPAPPADPAGVPAPSSAGAVATLDLSPRAAAMTLPHGPVDGTPPVSDRAADRGAALSADLRAAAGAQVDALRFQRKLELRREPDGTCHYQGTAFNATIHPDGGVEFAERDLRAELRGPEEPPEKPVTVEDTQAEQRVEASIKFTPHAVDAERSWFMRATQRLRDELSDAALARDREIGLRRELDRIWCDENRTKPQRRQAIFELWADTSGDEVGARGRRAILDYVRRNLPADSADAYTNEELTLLNLDRTQRDRFDPYTAAAP